ncbi:LysR family transcriptional regulator [Lysobacter arvi]|uniref:LysR family transcriptional regulator n=1 Tax=Lysobacter arvi TaxID=3038776 RepID=A0ABU1CC81_9GAMM|nr:LysR family transcriptional regulator [Lysobacter arvi]MDR0182019.1 LysR family transcriptional regulator [Lysobacter arvi]
MSTIPIAHKLTSSPSAWVRFPTNFTHVVAFISVAREGNFARAADRLGVGRSAVSRSVRKLEDHLGARLLSRTTRSVSLTGEGQAFYDACWPGVAQIVLAMEELQELRAGPPAGELRIAAPQSFGRQVVAPLLAEFQALYPALSLELRLGEGAVDFAADRIDVAFRDGDLEDRRVHARLLAPMQLQVHASRDYASRHGLPTSIEDLTRHACINLRLPNGRLQEWHFRSEERAHAVTPDARLVFNDSSLVLQAAIDGMGLAQLPACIGQDAVAAGKLMVCLDHVAPENRSHYICYLSRRQQPARIQAFVDFMTRRIREPA